MVNILYFISLAAIIVSLGVITCITDLRASKILNKHILVFGIIGLIVQGIFLIYDAVFEGGLFNNYIIARFFLNLFIGFVLSIVLYRYKIWAAGDAKLYSLLLFLVPYNFYFSKTVAFFPGFNLLVYTFGLGFIYFALETIILSVKGIIKKEESSTKSLSSIFWDKVVNYLKEFVPQLVLTYATANIFTELVIYFLPEGYNSDKGLFMLINVLIISSVLKIRNRKLAYKVSIILSSIYFIYRILNIYLFSKSTYNNPILFFIIVLIILINRMSNKFNYREIPSLALKPGMIISFGTVMLFSMSRVKGLPSTTSETTDSRITVEEAESIKRWAQSKRGQDTIIIVRHVPFAPFILIGAVVQLLLILKYYL